MANRFLSNIKINDAYTFPATDGTTGQVITTDGSGNLSFSDVSSLDGARSNFVYYDVKNSSGSTINKGTAVMAAGTDGNSGHILIAPMVADGSVEPKYFMGVLETTLLNGEIGKVVHFGQISQLNTTAFADGDILWCDPANAGGFTITEPLGPNLKIAAAIVISSAVNGKIKVRVQGNAGLHELHDVKLVSEVNGDLLQWNGTVWENKSLATIADSRYVNVSGDSMTGDLSIAKDNPILSIADTNSTNRYAGIKLQTAGGSWHISSGDSTTSASSQLYIHRDEDGTSKRFIFHRDDYYFGVYDNTNTIKALINSSGNSYFVGGNVGIGTTSPKAKLDINGTIVFNSKSMSVSDTFATALTINMTQHTGCYVKITAFGDWANHSSSAYLGEFFIQHGNDGYMEPGTIIRQVDNTHLDSIEAKIVDPTGIDAAKDFTIQLRSTSGTNTPFIIYLQYEVRGQFNSVS